MAISATLDAANEVTDVLIVPRGKTAFWTVDVTSLVNGDARLFVSRDGRGTWQAAARVTADTEGRIFNDTAGDIYLYFALIETASSISGSAAVAAEVEASVSFVVRDVVTDQPLMEFGDYITPLVPLDFSVQPEYASNAAALAGGAAVGSVYATATGELRVVVEA